MILGQDRTERYTDGWERPRGKPARPYTQEAHCGTCGEVTEHLVTQYDNVRVYWCYDRCGAAFQIAAKRPSRVSVVEGVERNWGINEIEQILLFRLKNESERQQFSPLYILVSSDSTNPLEAVYQDVMKKGAKVNIFLFVGDMPESE